MINTADQALAKLLDGEIKVRDKKIYAYTPHNMPLNTIMDSYIMIEWNGAVQSLTKALGILRGNLAVTISCKTTNYSRTAVDDIISKAISLLHCKSSDGYYFELDEYGFIVPPTNNLENGYTSAVLNIKWRKNT